MIKYPTASSRNTCSLERGERERGEVLAMRIAIRVPGAVLDEHFEDRRGSGPHVPEPVESASLQKERLTGRGRNWRLGSDGELQRPGHGHPEVKRHVVVCVNASCCAGLDLHPRDAHLGAIDQAGGLDSGTGLALG